MFSAVLCNLPQRHGVKDKNHMEYSGNESSLKGEKLMDKLPKVKIFRRPTTTHEYRRHSVVFLQMYNIYEGVRSICSESLLHITFF